MASSWVWVTLVSSLYRVSGTVAPNATVLISTSTHTTNTISSSEISAGSTSNGLGHYIISGLGAGSSDSLTASSPPLSSNNSSSPATAPTTTTRKLYDSLNSNTTSKIANDTDLACQASSVSWYLAGNSIESNSANYDTLTNVYTTIYAGDISYGTADVYTTLHSFPHAHGNFTVTSTSPFTTASVWTDFDPELKSNVSYPAAPDCTIASSACSSMYRSYRRSLGIASTAPIPVIYPIPTNSPQCYDPQSEAALSTFNASTLPCDITGTNVQLFYWAPPATDGGDTSVTTGPAVITTIYKNVTMTSPSIYLSFDTLEANRLVTGHENQYIPVGKVYTNPPIVSINPSELSTLTKTISGKDMANVVDQIAHGGPNYLEYVSLLYLNYFDGGQNNYSAVPVNGANIATPDPMAYYLGGGWSFNGPPGCQTGFSEPECGTIFDDPYRAQLAVPREVRNIDPHWATCNLPLFGVYDPPHVLEPAASAAEPTPSSMAPVQTASPGSPAMPSFPRATAHVESSATAGLQLPPPKSASAAAKSAPSAGAAGGDPSGASQGASGAGSSIGQNQGSGGDPSSGSGEDPGSRHGSGQGSGGSQGSGNDSGSNEDQDPGEGQASASVQTSGSSQGTGSDQDPGRGQAGGAAPNAGAIVASVVHGPGPSAQGNNGPEDPSRGFQGQHSAGQIIDENGGINEGGPWPGSSDSGSSGSGNPGSGSSGSGSSGSGNPGSGSSGSGSSDSGNPGPGKSGSGSSDSGNPGSGSSGSGSSGSGNSDSGISDSGSSRSGSLGPGSLGSEGSGSEGSGTGNSGAGSSDSKIPVQDGNTPGGSDSGPNQPAALAAGNEPARPIATVGGQTVSFGPAGSGVEIDGSQLSKGGTTNLAGNAISYGSAGLVIGTGTAASTVPIPNNAAAGTDSHPSLTPIATVAGQVLSANPSDPDQVILPNGQTVSEGGAAATFDGSRVSVGPGGKLIVAGSSGSQTITLPTRAAVLTGTASGAIITGTDGAIVTAVETTIAGRPEVLLEEHGSVVMSLTVGGAVATVDGEVVSAGPDGLAVKKSDSPQSTVPYSTVSATEPGNGGASSVGPSESGKTSDGIHPIEMPGLLILTYLMIMRWL